MATKRAASSKSSTTTTDHDEIRQWAESRGAKPACVKGTGGKRDTGMIRLDFPGYSGGDSLQKISWKDFFEKFDDQKLALVYQAQTADGEQSNFNKLVRRPGERPGRPARKSSTRAKSKSARSPKRRAGAASTAKSSPSRASSSSSRHGRGAK